MSATAVVHYHAPWEREPAILIDVRGEPGRRVDPPLQAHRVRLRDARGEASVSFRADGLAFARSPTSLRDFSDTASIASVYEAELQAVIAEHTGAAEVVVFDHTVRSEGTQYRPPARHAHNDYTPASGRQRLFDILGESRARDWAAGHFGIVNAWRPIGMPIERAPLAFARPDTVAPHDWVGVQLVYPGRRGEISGLLPSDDHEWIYLSRMEPSEVALFRVFDSEGRAPVAHSAVDPEGVAQDAPARQSIESRALVRFDPVESGGGLNT